MLVLNKIIFSENEPPQTNVLWARPVDGGYAFYIFSFGKWDILRLVNNMGTDTPFDDVPIDIHEGQLGPDTVGTEQIIDGSVIMDDLNDNVKEKIQKTYYQDEEELHMGFDIAGEQSSDDETNDSI